jgi:16S rRNA (guanine966-N2)-methyltransferase
MKDNTYACSFWLPERMRDVLTKIHKWKFLSNVLHQPEKSYFCIMRIISGKFRGRQLRPPKGLPARPTTDRTREALFNILQNQVDISDLQVLDLFSGTGSVSLEFLSRGAQKVVSVDKHRKSIGYLKSQLKALQLEDKAQAVAGDAFTFLQRTTDRFDLIFMDPPYELPNQELLILTSFERALLNPEGILILEHRTGKDYAHLPNYDFTKTYGDSSLSFFFSQEKES